MPYWPERVNTPSIYASQSMISVLGKKECNTLPFFLIKAYHQRIYLKYSCITSHIFFPFLPPYWKLWDFRVEKIIRNTLHNTGDFIPF